MSAANGNYEGTGLEIAVIGMAGRSPEQEPGRILGKLARRRGIGHFLYG